MAQLDDTIFSLPTVSVCFGVISTQQKMNSRVKNNNSQENRRNHQQHSSDRDHNRHTAGVVQSQTQAGQQQGLPLPTQRAGQYMPMVPMLTGAQTYEIPIREKAEEEKKFTGRCRLFIANLPPNVNEEKLKNLFEQYGEVAEVFLGKQNAFAFVKMDTRKHAEEARSALDNKMYDNRTLRVRLAAHAAAVRVRNMSPMVTNELLEFSFSFFGEIERAIVITDDRGRSIGEGIVEFARKSSAQNCIKRCAQDCFLLTANPAPVIVEPFEQKDEDDGFGEKHVNKNSQEFRIEREIGPRFAEPGSFEYEFGCRFKQLYDIEKEKRARLEQEIQDARRTLLEQMEYQRVEHQTKMLKDKLRELEEKSSVFDDVRNRSMEQERAREEERQREELLLRQREEEILRRSQMADFPNLRRQENDLRLQATALQDMLSQQEIALNEFQQGPVDPQVYGMAGPYDGRMQAYDDSFAYDTFGPTANGPPMEIGTRYGHTGATGPQGAGVPRGGPGGRNGAVPTGQSFNRPSPYGKNRNNKRFQQ